MVKKSIRQGMNEPRPRTRDGSRREIKHYSDVLELDARSRGVALASTPFAQKAKRMTRKKLHWY